MVNGNLMASLKFGSSLSQFLALNFTEGKTLSAMNGMDEAESWEPLWDCLEK